MHDCDSLFGDPKTPGDVWKTTYALGCLCDSREDLQALLRACVTLYTNRFGDTPPIDERATLCDIFDLVPRERPRPTDDECDRMIVGVMNPWSAPWEVLTEDEDDIV